MRVCGLVGLVASPACEVNVARGVKTFRSSVIETSDVTGLPVAERNGDTKYA